MIVKIEHWFKILKFFDRFSQVSFVFLAKE
jgi:hypothetical protein